jgi:hypothetical protein
MTKAQVSGSLLLRIHSVTAYPTPASSSVSSTALARLILRRRCATQYLVACVCERSLVIVSCHRGRHPLRRFTWSSAKARPGKPGHAAEQPAARAAHRPPKRKRVASSLRLELLGWTSDASCSSFDAVGDLSGATRRCGKSERRDGRPRTALVEQQRPTTQGHRDTCAKMILWQSGPRVRKYKIPCS